MIRIRELQEIIDQVNIKFAQLEGTIEYLRQEIKELKETKDANQKSIKGVQVGKQRQSVPN